MAVLSLLIAAAALAVLYFGFIESLYVDKKSRIPGPKLFALTKWRLAFEDWTGQRTRTIDRLHREYGPVVRVGPNEVHFNSITALRTIYGAGSGFERTNFYRMFDVYGKQNVFTFRTTKQHGDRKKLLANAYSKSRMLHGSSADMVEAKVKEYMDLLAETKGAPNEIFTSLHWFSLDSITAFLYGPNKLGGTSCLKGSAASRALLNDIMDPARRTLTWFRVHFPSLTIWLYTRSNALERLLQPFLPMQKPATFTGIRAHALKAWQDFKKAAEAGDPDAFTEPSIMNQLYKSHTSQSSASQAVDDMDIASECADHLLAGIDTTSDSTMFLIWALSRSGAGQKFQQRLIDEVKSIPASAMTAQGVPQVDSCDKLPYLDAVIKEVVRLYAPLPATEPRSLPTDCVIDGFAIPAGTVVGMAPYSLHRVEIVFKDPHTFNPERWLGPKEEVAEMNRWFWGFSSGGRMCIGVHLAMAEMTTLVAAIYRKYTTAIAPGFENKTPAISSRFEMFYDETVPELVEHTCMITFTEQSS